MILDHKRFVLDSLKVSVQPTLVSKNPFEKKITTQEWTALKEYALCLHALPIFYLRISNSDFFNLLDDQMQSEVFEGIKQNSIADVLFQNEIEAVSQTFLKSGVPFVLLKGADLKSRVYSDPLLRPMSDLDILVSENNYDQSIKVFLNSGYQFVAPFDARRFRCELQSPETKVVVELHKKMLIDDTSDELRGIWKRAELCPSSGKGLALDSADCLVYLMRHCAIQHVVESPIWLNDLNLLISKELDLDWGEVLRKLQTKRSLSASWFLFQLLRQEWATSIPVSIFDAIRSQINKYKRTLLRNLASSENWFHAQNRSAFWVVKSRYLLRDTNRDFLKYSLARLMR